jgi:hypothetical protein
MRVAHLHRGEIFAPRIEKGIILGSYAGWSDCVRGADGFYIFSKTWIRENINETIVWGLH